MLRNFKRFTLQVVAGANLATIFMMLFVGFSAASILSSPSVGHAGLVFPVFLAINFGFLIFWLCFKKKGVLLSLAGYLVCYVPVRTYIPFNIPHSIPDDADQGNVLQMCGVLQVGNAMLTASFLSWNTSESSNLTFFVCRKP